MRIVSGALALLLGFVLVLYGLLLILWQGDAGSEGDTHMEFGDLTVDADLAGAVVLLLGAALVGFSIWAFRRRVS